MEFSSALAANIIADDTEEELSSESSMLIPMSSNELGLSGEAVIKSEVSCNLACFQEDVGERELASTAIDVDLRRFLVIGHRFSLFVVDFFFVFVFIFIF